MTWVRLDDGFVRHPRMVAAGLHGRALFIAGLCYCGAHLTDGHIPKAALPMLAAEAGVKVATSKRLVEVGSWIDRGDSFVVHDFLVYNPSREKVTADREVSRRRWALNNDPELRRIIRERDGDECRYCGREVNWRDRKSVAGGTYDHVIPISRGGSDDASNIVVCCRACNTTKGARTPEEAGMPLRDLAGYLAGIKQESTPESGPDDPSRPVVPSGQEPSLSAPPKSKRGSSIPDVFEVDDSMRVWASEHCPHVRLDLETEQWRDFHRAKGDTAKDWRASWRTWMRNAQKWTKPQRPSTGAHVGAGPNGARRMTAEELNV